MQKGVGTPITAQAKDQTLQIDQFKKNLYERVKDLKAGRSANLSKLSDFGLSEQEMIAIYAQAMLQLYKFAELPIGEDIKLNSPVCLNAGVDCYVRRDFQGNFQLVLRKIKDDNEIYYRTDVFPIKKWDPDFAFYERLQYFKSRVKDELPAHLSPYLQGESDVVFDVLIDKIQPLKPGESVEIKPDIPLKYPLHALRTQAGEYQALIETGNEKEPFLRVDCFTKSVLVRDKNDFLDEQAILFLDRMKATKNLIAREGIPPELAKLVTAQDVLTSLDFIISNPGLLRKLSSGEGIYLSKKAHSFLARTLNVVRQQNGEYMLMLETKSKLSSGIKDKARTIGKGGYGTVKPSWRIDCAMAEEWVNKTMKGKLVEEAEYEALFSQNLLREHVADPDLIETMNVTILGELYKGQSEIKRSQYSKRAIGDLKQVEANPKILFNYEDIRRITRNILEGIAVIHSQDKVHQDIKFNNILIYPSEEGYYAKVADFGVSYDPKFKYKKPALASVGYESPEISLAYEDKKSPYHKYFYHYSSPQKSSLGFQVNQNNADRKIGSNQAVEYSVPHQSNDIWAIGIVLFKLNFGHKPNLNNVRDLQLIQGDPLLEGLLKFKRAERFTVEEALHKFYEITGQTPVIRTPALTFGAKHASSTKMRPEPPRAQKNAVLPNQTTPISSESSESLGQSFDDKTPSSNEYSMGLSSFEEDPKTTKLTKGKTKKSS